MHRQRLGNSFLWASTTASPETGFLRLQECPETAAWRLRSLRCVAFRSAPLERTSERACRSFVRSQSTRADRYHRWLPMFTPLGRTTPVCIRACLVTACFTNVIISQLSCHAAQLFYFYSTTPFIHSLLPPRNLQKLHNAVLFSNPFTELAEMPRPLYARWQRRPPKKREHAVTLSFARCHHGSARALSADRTKTRMHSDGWRAPRGATSSTYMWVSIRRNQLIN